jgi:hypothetical protein
MGWDEEATEMNRSILNEFSRDVEHIPSGSSSSTTVRAVKQDPQELAAHASLLVLFADGSLSGFSQAPQKNDEFIVDGITYRAFEVLGPDAANGLYIHLTK